MGRRQPLPTCWLLTDERMTDVMAAARGLPRGAGILFRHHGTPDTERRALFTAVRGVARARRQRLLLAAPPAVARNWGADGAHHRSLLRSTGLRSVAVHNPRQAIMARRVGADLIFVSPAFATRTHPGWRAIGVRRASQLARLFGGPTYLLGGMTAARWRRLRDERWAGWAAIDALAPAA